MLDIAEHVFELMAEKMRSQNLTVKKTFGKHFQVLEQFEGEKDVLVLTAQDFLDGLNKLIDDESLGELEIACIMRVLSKPEIEHCILVTELAIVLNNFGIGSEEAKDPENMKEETE